TAGVRLRAAEGKLHPFLGEQGEKSAVITKNSQRETSDWQSSMLRHTGGVELTSVFGCFFNLLGI
ncbi:hypothetical protein MZH10_29680, partial [Escherichia coli]|nr:hypothetical protein [Escherichia coli]